MNNIIVSIFTVCYMLVLVALIVITIFSIIHLVRLFIEDKDKT